MSSDASNTAQANGGAGGYGGSGASGASPIGNGSSTTTASSMGGMVKSMNAVATAPVASTSRAESRAAVGASTVPGLGAGSQAMAFASGAPQDTAVLAMLAGNPLVHADFDVGGASTVLGALALGGAYSDSGSGGLFTYSSRATFGIDMTSLLAAPQDLLIGLLDYQDSGLGFDQLQFRVSKEGIWVIDQTFTLLDDARSYFNDHTLNIGDWTIGLSTDNVLDLAFYMDVVANDIGAAFRANLLFGDSTIGSGPVVPLPPALWLFGSGLAAVLGFTRRKAAGHRPGRACGARRNGVARGWFATNLRHVTMPCAPYAP